MSSSTRRSARSRNLSRIGKVSVGVGIAAGTLVVLAAIGSGVVLYRMMKM